MNIDSNIKKVIVLYGLIALVLILLFLEFKLLGFNFMLSDVLSYWNDSLNWRTPFHRYHVPFYPLLIAFFRGISFNIFPPLTYMVVITLFSLVISLISINKIISILGIDPRIQLISNFLLAFWPLAGVFAIIYPLADYVVISLFLAGLALFLHEKPTYGAIIWGLALITHKAIWPFVAFMFLFWVIRTKKILKQRTIFYVLLIILPLALLWAAGSINYSELNWLFSSNLSEIHNNEFRYPFRGVVDTFLLGDQASFLKGFILLYYILITIFLMLYLVKIKPKFYLYGLGICIPLLVTGISLNEGLTWAFVRFSRLLVIPIIFVLGNELYNFEKLLLKPMYKFLTITLGLLLVLSQFVFAFYMAKFYFV